MPIGYEKGGSGEARRTRSLPSKYMIPSEELGEYESASSRRKSAPVQSSVGGLYPLDEQGTYGAASGKPGMPPSGVPFQRIRERKPKVYSSYSVDSNCQMHSQKLANAEKKLEEGIRRHSSANGPSASRSASRASASPAPYGRHSSQGPRSPSRGSSSGSRSSRSPEPFHNGVSGHRKPSFDKKNSLYGPNSGQRNNRSASRGFQDVHKSSIDEQEEYTYYENNGYRPSRKKVLEQNDTGNRQSSVSIDGMRKPKIDSWDSMGILGLTTKIWNDTKTRQETFMESTGHLLREENSSYIM